MEVTTIIVAIALALLVLKLVKKIVFKIVFLAGIALAVMYVFTDIIPTLNL